jgi:hypothetical protein
VERPSAKNLNVTGGLVAAVGDRRATRRVSATQP